MDNDKLNRKEFIVLTFTLVGSAAAAGCSDSGGGSPTGSGGMGGTMTCSDPLGSTQVADDTGHTHNVTVPMSVLQATTPQTFTTSSAGAHTHTVTLTTNALGMIRTSGAATVNSSTDNNHMHAYRVTCQA